MNDTLEIKGYPIGSILRSLGYPFDYSGGRADVMIRSPFHEEKTPSFHYNIKGNWWMDFSIGIEERRWSNVDLVMRLLSCSERHAFDYIRGLMGSPVQELMVSEFRKAASAPSRPSGLRVDRVSDCVSSAALRKYALHRGITRVILERYCCQVRYSVLSTGKTYNAIGFPNNSGGFALHTQHFKGSTVSDCSFLDRYGRPTSAPTSDAVMVFEGFFNFLSHAAMFGIIPECDVIVLNSVSNVAKALPFFTGHSSATLWLDNDDAGRKATRRLLSSSSDMVMVDRSPLYLGYNDLNDMLTGKVDGTLKIMKTEAHNTNGHPLTI